MLTPRSQASSVPDLGRLSFRDQREIMERPFFSLAKRKRIKPIEYVSPDKKVFVRVSPSSEFGMATIWDADILIWAISRQNQWRKQGKEASRIAPFFPHEILKGIGRQNGGREYRLLREALARLQSTTIVTNIRVEQGKQQRQFSWIDSWTDLTDEAGKQSQGMTLWTAPRLNRTGSIADKA